MERVISEYVDEVVETRRRRVQVVEEVTARLSAWHGGRHLCDLGGFTSTVAAIREAEEIVLDRYRVTSESSLHLRVLEARSQTYREALPDGRVADVRTRRPRQVYFRHVWDSHVGMIQAEPASADVDATFPVGFPVGTSPGDACTRLVQALHLTVAESSPILALGLGLGELSITDCRKVLLAGPPEGSRAGEKSYEWIGLRVRGNLNLWVPRELPDTRIREFLEALTPSPELDSAMLAVYGQRVAFFAIDQGDGPSFVYPAAIDASLPPASDRLLTA